MHSRLLFTPGAPSRAFPQVQGIPRQGAPSPPPTLGHPHEGAVFGDRVSCVSTERRESKGLGDTSEACRPSPGLPTRAHASQMQHSHHWPHHRPCRLHLSVPHSMPFLRKPSPRPAPAYRASPCSSLSLTPFISSGTKSCQSYFQRSLGQVLNLSPGSPLGLRPGTAPPLPLLPEDPLGKQT